jgi:hypothetical protein
MTDMVRSPDLVRLGGLVLLAGGALCTAGMLVHPASPRDPFDGPLHVGYFLALLAVLLGLPALTARQTEAAGFLGLIGGVGVWLGLAMSEVPHAVISGTILPALLADPSTAALIDNQSVLYANLMHGAFRTFMSTGEVLLLIGGLVLAGTTLWSRTLPRWPAVLLVLGLGGTLVLPDGPVGPTLFFAGLTGFGLSIAFRLGPETIRRKTTRPVAAEV